MMKPEVYDDTNNTSSPRPAQLQLVASYMWPVLREAGSGTPLLTFTPDGVFAHHNACHHLARAGVDTTFADWDGNGCMVVEPLP